MSSPSSYIYHNEANVALDYCIKKQTRIAFHHSSGPHGSLSFPHTWTCSFVKISPHFLNIIMSNHCTLSILSSHSYNFCCEVKLTCILTIYNNFKKTGGEFQSPEIAIFGPLELPDWWALISLDIYVNIYNRVLIITIPLVSELL